MVPLGLGMAIENKPIPNFHAVNWIISPDAVEKEAVHFSNYVTERSNEVGTPIGTPEKYLDTANQLTDGYNLVVLV